MIIKKVKPLFDYIVTTMDKYEDDVMINNALIDSNKSKGMLKEIQKVVAVGNAASSYIKEGDLVAINPTRFAVPKRNKDSWVNDIEGNNPVLTYRFDTIEIDNQDYLFLQTRDIKYIVEEYSTEDESESTKKSIILPENKIIV